MKTIYNCENSYAVISGNGVNNVHHIKMHVLSDAMHVFDLELKWSLDNVPMVPLNAESKKWENPNYQPSESDLYRVELVEINTEGDIINTIKSSEEYYIID